MFMSMLDSGSLQLLCVDEAHLFVQFGLFFREEFIQLKSLLFEKLLQYETSVYMKIPVLFMTATANQTILSQLERITGYTFLKHNVFWPPAPQMLEPKVRMTFRYTPMPMLALKKRLEPLYKADDRRQWLLFANSRKELENNHLKSREFLDVANLPGDIVMINGPMFREQKFFYTNLFLNPELVDVAALLRGDDDSTEAPVDSDVINFDAIGCLAMRSLGSAGWDGEHIRLVFSVDFPTDLCSCTQEKYRAGRWPGAGPKTDEYYVCATLHSFLYLLKRIYRDEKDKDFAALDKILSQKEYRVMLFNDLILVAKMFVLATECYHCFLARRLGNLFMMPYNLSVPLTPCGTTCDFCLRLAGDTSATKPFPSVLKSGVKRMLLDLFIGEHRMLRRETVAGTEGLYARAK
jgi:hypothetical protein